ncbi:MAG TPA: bifunctional nuclease family protein [bacterium]|nr:bifunctional nuclease family protein [bacterium]
MALDGYELVESINLARDDNDNNALLLTTYSKKIVVLAIGDAEAHSIMLELNKKKYARPLTHDLMKNMLIAVNYKIERALITDLKNNTYYALIRIVSEDGKNIAHLDARPSDAIAMALRFEAEIYVNENLLTQISD